MLELDQVLIRNNVHITGNGHGSIIFAHGFGCVQELWRFVVIANQFARVTFLSDNREDLTNLKIPVLILQCVNDVIAPEEVGWYVHQQIENSTLNIMEDLGHCPNLSAPEETIRLIKNYLQSSRDQEAA